MEKIGLNQENIIAEIKNALANGRVLLMPCDTVYGLFCDAQNESVIARIFSIKGRDFNKPVGIYVKDIAMAKELAEIDDNQEKLLQKYWPGKVTFILKKKPGQLENIGTQETIGIRIPGYSLFQDLFKEISFPLAQTSANISGQPALTKIQEVLNYFQNQKQQPDLVIDAGNLAPAQPSTVVDLTSQKPKILRYGEVKIS